MLAKEWLDDMNEKDKNSSRIKFQPILIVFLIVIGIGIIILLQTKKTTLNLSGSEKLEAGMPAPNFIVPDLDGNMISLADYRGNIVFLNIWATWCPPCVAEMPSIEKLHQTLKGEDFKILAVSIDDSGAGGVKSFMEQHRLNFHALIDSNDMVKNRYQINGIPESFVIDKNGIILKKIIGPADWASPDAIEYFQAQLQERK